MSDEVAWENTGVCGFGWLQSGIAGACSAGHHSLAQAAAGLRCPKNPFSPSLSAKGTEPAEVEPAKIQPLPATVENPEEGAAESGTHAAKN